MNVVGTLRGFGEHGPHPGAAAGSAGFDAEPAAVGLTNVLCHCQAQTHAALLFGVKRLTQAGERRRTEPRALVLDDDRHQLRGILQAHAHPPAARHRLHRPAH